MYVLIQHSNEIAIHINILENLRIQWKQQATLVSLNRDLANIVWTCLCLEMKMKLFFLELWHVCYTKSCVKKFGGGKINEIYSGTISCADVNMMPHCLTSENKHAIKLTMQSTDAVYNIQHSLSSFMPFINSFGSI